MSQRLALVALLVSSQGLLAATLEVTARRTDGAPPPTVVARSPVPTSVTERAGRSELCLGALGMQCGQPQGGLPPTALCSGGSCFINGGSWDHDECCYANPRGMACQPTPHGAATGHDGNCVTAWEKALRLTSKGILWRRSIDFSCGNSTGRVDFNLYCAPRNTLLSPEDARRCCSGRARALVPAEVPASVAARETLVACE